MLVDAHYNSGSACFELGRIDETIEQFANAARLKPDDAEIRNSYGGTLFCAGKVADAVVQFETAVRLKPDNSDAQDNLEVARAEFRRREAKRAIPR